MPLLSVPTLKDSHRWAGMRVGLLGGTFNPPHEGHLHISLAALKGLKLDCVWWLVTPQNPLKADIETPLARRVEMCRELVDHPRVLVTDIERQLGTSVTFETVRQLRLHYPSTDFVWISGMDNALSLHRWNRWQDLLGAICMVHLTRPPAKSLIRGCPLRMLGRQRHRVISQSGAYPLDSGTTYWMMQKKMVDVSSTDIRNNSFKNKAL